MSDLPHLRIPSNQTSEKYTYAGATPVNPPPFKLPARNKPAHVTKLRSELRDAETEAEARRTADVKEHPELAGVEPAGLVLVFSSDPDFELWVQSLDRQRSGIILLSLKEEERAQVAKVFVPQGKLGSFLKLVNAYAASVILTFLADAANEQKLKDLADPDNGVKFQAPVRLQKGGKIKIQFLVDEAKAVAFQAKVGEAGVLLSTTRKSEKLIESIASVRLALVKDFWQDRLPFPAEEAEMWWEVWLHGTRKTATADHARFVELAARVGITKVSPRFVAFPERVVVHTYTSAKRLAASIDLLAMFTELRKAKELAAYYVNAAPAEQREFIDDLLAKLEVPGPNAPCVSVLDRGVNRGHPLLEQSLAQQDMHTAVSEWGLADSCPHQHGTGMAGLALYGCLTEVMTEVGSVVLRHNLESIKILPPPPATNSPPDFGRVMQDGVTQAHIRAAQRNRVLCMAVSSPDRDMGLPTLWSGAVDDLCAGVITGKQTLMLISAGNIREEFDSNEYVYHQWNTQRANIDDPGQAWNALTVGAITEKVNIEEDGCENWEVLAQSGDLSPRSRTSLPWPEENQKGWPIKPDIVMEGGNYAWVPAGGYRSSNDDLSMLTTILHPTGRLFDTIRDTSPATALAARYAAIIWSRYPKLWPETVRALLVHSATWNARMLERFPGKTKTAAHRRLRCYGYGVPDLKRALHSAENAVSLTFQGEFQPFQQKGSNYTSNEMHLIQLPWPVEVLQGLGEKYVRMRVTLSYFIEPSPASIGWKVNHRYASHGLRFDVIRPTEGLDEFKRRISRDFWVDKKRPASQAEETRNWVIGDQGRTNGSIHSDWWVGRAAELAACGRIAVYPVTGWWKERSHLGRFASKARYSMVVSLESDDAEVDLYTPISQIVNVQTEIVE